MNLTFGLWHINTSEILEFANAIGLKVMTKMLSYLNYAMMIFNGDGQVVHIYNYVKSSVVSMC